MISNEKFLNTMESELYNGMGIHSCYAKYAAYLKLEDIYTTDSVYIAACHCALGFRDRNDTMAFMDHAWVNSMRLAKEVLSGTFKPEYYKRKEILERGKPRIIRPPKFECKVVQKVLCDYMLRAILEPKMINTSYASIRGRGTDKMHEDILRALNKGSFGSVIVMTDFSGFFASIDTDLLCETFLSWGMDKKIVDLFHSFDPEGVGLSLGNEASQVPASYFPSPIDHTLKDYLGLKSVFRFMDDTLIIAKDMNEVEICLSTFRSESEKISLVVKEQKTQIIPWGKEFIFCKERYYFNKKDKIYYRIQNPKIATNEIRKLKAFERKLADGTMSEKDIIMQAGSVIGSMKQHPNNKKQVARVEKKLTDVLPETSRVL